MRSSVPDSALPTSRSWTPGTGLVKLDTQGSEVDILKSARNFLETFTPRLILLETSVFRYNLEAGVIGRSTCSICSTRAAAT